MKSKKLEKKCAVCGSTNIVFDKCVSDHPSEGPNGEPCMLRDPKWKCNNCGNYGSWYSDDKFIFI
jgi:hypothetical protein